MTVESPDKVTSEIEIDERPKIDLAVFGLRKPRYAEPQPICDPSSDFEEMDRGDGFGVDDTKTYCRTER